mmetsp:Transcript_3355/g.6288  ORF Transcript_3355/g.6288 Transcript_3355/m.6288 type:complete len:99 (+) Transcript_3355:401-697(+)
MLSTLLCPRKEMTVQKVPLAWMGRMEWMEWTGQQVPKGRPDRGDRTEMQVPEEKKARRDRKVSKEQQDCKGSPGLQERWARQVRRVRMGKRWAGRRAV